MTSQVPRAKAGATMLAVPLGHDLIGPGRRATNAKNGASVTGLNRGGCVLRNSAISLSQQSIERSAASQGDHRRYNFM
jgi:hypothetical protein